MTATVPAGPFVDWLRHELENAANVDALRDRLGLGGGSLRELLETDPLEQLPLERVDRYLTRADTGETLATLYPEEQHCRADRGRSYVCDEQTLTRAHRMHLDGMSVRAVARELFDACFSASPAALAMALTTAWHGRGWEVRSRRAATVAANRARATRPFCEHVHAIGERRGQRCSRRASGNDRWCWHHHPDRVAAGIAEARRAVAA